MAEVHTVRSYTKGLDLAPRKVSIVASLVRGRSVNDALVILDNVPRRAALPLKKAIESAKANATTNHQLDGKSLEIQTLSVTAGPRMRRFKPASRGRALPFAKKSSHVLVVLSGTKVVKKKPATAKTTTKATTTTATESTTKPVKKESK